MRRIPAGSVRVLSEMILTLAAVAVEDSRIRSDKHHPQHEKARRDGAMLEAVLKTLALG